MDIFDGVRHDFQYFFAFKTWSSGYNNGTAFPELIDVVLLYFVYQFIGTINLALDHSRVNRNDFWIQNMFR